MKDKEKWTLLAVFVPVASYFFLRNPITEGDGALLFNWLLILGVFIFAGYAIYRAIKSEDE